MADYLYRQFAQIMVIVVGECLRRCDNDTLAGVYAQRVEVLHVADSDTVVIPVSHHFVFNLFPTLERFLHKHLRGERERLFGEHFQLLGIVAETASETSEGICRTHYHRIAETFGRRKSLVDALYSLALDGFYIYLVKFFDEQLAVLRVLDCLHRGTEHFYVIFVKDAALAKLHTAVQRGLAAERQKYAVGTLFLDHALHEIRSDRQEIDLVCKSVGGLYGGDIGIDEHGLDALLFHGFQSLGAGVVEFAGLTDFQCAAAEKKNFFNLFHA